MIKNLNKKNKKKGFTLIELIIVIAIIAILAAIAIPRFGDVRNNANEKADIANAKSIAGMVAAGIADDKVTLPADATDYNLDSVGGVNISESIDGSATAKSVQGGEYMVRLDEDGNIEVYVVAAGATSIPEGAKQVYPVVNTDDTED